MTLMLPLQPADDVKHRKGDSWGVRHPKEAGSRQLMVEVARNRIIFIEAL